MAAVEDQIARLLSGAPYWMPPEDKSLALLEVLREQLGRACQSNAGLRNYMLHWPIELRSARKVADLPYLPVGLLKARPPLSLVDAKQIKRILTSSSTTGQTPSRVVLDSVTARRMTKGVVAIVQDFIGSARRPYLVVDVEDSVRAGGELGARGAAIRSLQPFAGELAYALGYGSRGELRLERDKVLDFAKRKRVGPVLIYGFTYIIWNCLVKPLAAAGICLDMPEARILHSGGWKRLQEEAVEKGEFNRSVARVFGCSPDCVIDFYGMIEQVGVIYPDCKEGNKHAPRFAEVIVRDPLTLEPVCEGEFGILQVCSVLPGSFPGHLLLTEDMAQVVMYDGCPCGRRGIGFRFAGRVPKAEMRGCGNLDNRRWHVPAA
ncbi:MAG: hypothetical protein P4L55_11080 [Syntrophobacteraceae bacterium]|nr:hypothetical protein [Syntrophobacteraceae bacterium]